VLSHEGKSVTLGVRPEDVYDADLSGGIEGTRFTARVDVLEKLGAEDTAYLKVGEHSLIATLDPKNRLEMGADHDFVVDLKKIHYFDGESDQAIR
jgi:multiple sugar transport system ATP-binding protein